MSTKIEWCSYVAPDGTVIKGQTWNGIKGCSKAGYKPVDGGPKRTHPGCLHCYAERFCARNMHGEAATVGRWDGTIEFYPERLAWPFTKPGYKPRKDGHKTIVFLASESDMGHPNVPDEVWKAINGMMLLSPWIIWKDLTKRPEIQAERIERWSPAVCVDAFARLKPGGYVVNGRDWLKDGWPNRWDHYKHIHRYVSASDQATADSLIPELLRMPAAVRGISLEPMIGAVDLAYAAFTGAESFSALGNINHVIIGGESGPGARPFPVKAAWDVVLQCKAAGMPVYVKQLGRCPVVSNINSMDWPEHVNFADEKAVFGTAAGARVCLRSRKGSDPAEWPEALRVREQVL